MLVHCLRSGLLCIAANAPGQGLAGDRRETRPRVPWRLGECDYIASCAGPVGPVFPPAQIQSLIEAVKNERPKPSGMLHTLHAEDIRQYLLGFAACMSSESGTPAIASKHPYRCAQDENDYQCQGRTSHQHQGDIAIILLMALAADRKDGHDRTVMRRAVDASRAKEATRCSNAGSIPICAAWRDIGPANASIAMVRPRDAEAVTHAVTKIAATSVMTGPPNASSHALIDWNTGRAATTAPKPDRAATLSNAAPSRSRRRPRSRAGPATDASSGLLVQKCRVRAR